ncbi:MAG: transcriptional regulator, partial [Candidatus Buchananbacteria bacterium CG10_big_fil_rev_8_21_14_0_10_42_9]
MKFSTKAEYGIRALIALAKQGDKEPYSLPQIAREQKIPRAYLEHLFARLKRAGLITSTKGARGGYSLKVKPQDLTLYQVVAVLEDNFSPYFCTGSEDAACPEQKG